MSKGGRIINVCSMAGKQRILKADGLVQKFQVRREPWLPFLLQLGSVLRSWSFCCLRKLCDSPLATHHTICGEHA